MNTDLPFCEDPTQDCQSDPQPSNSWGSDQFYLKSQSMDWALKFHNQGNSFTLNEFLSTTETIYQYLTKSNQ